MNCPECADFLQRLLDGDAAPPDAAVQAHLAACPVCRQRHAAAQRLLRALPCLPAAAPPPGLTGRIVARVLLERRARLTWRRRGLAIAAAAALLLAPFLGLHWLRQPEPSRGGVVVVEKVAPTPPRHVAPEPKVEPLRPQLEETRVAVEGLTGRLNQLSKESLQPDRLVQTVSLPLEMTPLDSMTHLEPLNQPLGAATPGVHHAGQGMALGARSVSRTTQRALTYFMRDLPPLSAPKKRSL
jgi:hypothetical protein